MGFAETESSFVDRRAESSPGTGGHRPTRLRWRLLLTVAVGLALAPFLTSCSGFFISPSISSIFVQPASVTLGVGQMASLAATATYSDGSQKQISGNSVGWSSSATNISTVTSPGGSVTGVAIGTATITATSQGISGTAHCQCDAKQHYEPGHQHHPGKHSKPNRCDNQRSAGNAAVLCLRQWECSKRRDAIGNLDFVEQLHRGVDQ